MAAFDATASGEAVGASSVTVSLTTSGTNRALVGFIGSAFNPIRTVSSFTYAGVSLGTVRTENTNPNYLRGSLYCLANPASGANNLVGTISANADCLGVGGVSATAVDQTTPVRSGSPTNAVADSGTVTVTIPSAANDLVVDGVILGSSTGTPSLSVGAGQTQRWQQTQVYGAEAQSTEAGASPNVVMSWTGSGTGLAFVTTGLSLQDDGGGTPAVRRKHLLQMGVGR